MGEGAYAELQSSNFSHVPCTAKKGAHQQPKVSDLVVTDLTKPKYTCQWIFVSGKDKIAQTGGSLAGDMTHAGRDSS